MRKTAPKTVPVDPDAWKERYRTCRVCAKPVNKLTFEWACRKFQQQTCSTACDQAEIIFRYGCCSKATIRDCVCMYSTDCPEHGRRCTGSHD